MNKELAHVLKEKLLDIPFLEVVAGMVQVVEYDSPVYEGKTVKKRMPVAYDTNIQDCGTNIKENDLVPNSSKRGILYFEDGGVQKSIRTSKGMEFQSRLIMTVWLNRERLVDDKYEEISAKCQMALFEKLVTANPQNLDIFSRLKISVSRVLQQNKAVFANYSYDESIMQYLRPPFEFFAVELICSYTVSFGCIAKLNITGGTDC